MIAKTMPFSILKNKYGISLNIYCFPIGKYYQKDIG